MSRIVVDPVTRIEGHLRIEAEMNSDNVITEALSSGTMFRGVETILQGRDPRDAWVYAQRICGVCTLVHGIASVRAVENALNYPIPPNAQLIRNLMIAAQQVHDHVMHFYHLHALDWVDIRAVLEPEPGADPVATAALQQSLSPSWPNNTPQYFAEVKSKLQNFVNSGQLGIFTNGYWGHPAYKLSPEENLLAFAHYLEALAWQREVAKLHTIFGGKNPHPNFVVGGAPCAISINSNCIDYEDGRTALDSAGLELVKKVIREMQEFVNQVYLPDVLAIAGVYKDYGWANIGEGIGNFMTYGDFPNESGNLLIPGGVIMLETLEDKTKALGLNDVQALNLNDLEDRKKVREYVKHSWYDYRVGKSESLHPYNGETNPNYTGPTPPLESLNANGTYSWMKSPRWHDANGPHPMEVGPLARVLMLYATGHMQTKELVEKTLAVLGGSANNFRPLYSTLGRTAARAIETVVIADAMSNWYQALETNIRTDIKTFNESLWNPSTWPRYAEGVGFTEAPRGALAHWIIIENGKIANYQAVVPSTWNARPRDALEDQLGPSYEDQPGPYEAALVGHKIQDDSQPLEILRTIHSFDPCIACAVHLMDKDGKELIQVKVC